MQHERTVNYTMHDDRLFDRHTVPSLVNIDGRDSDL
jgi:hypothetical protein